MVLEPQKAGIPEPYPSPFTKPVWDGYREGKLLYQFFPASGRAQFYSGPIDRVSLSRDYELRESAGLGTIYSYTIVSRPQTPEFIAPYAAAIVDVDEGFQMITNIIGCEPEDVHVGMRVQVEYHRISDTLTLPYFTPIE